MQVVSLRPEIGAETGKVSGQTRAPAMIDIESVSQRFEVSGRKSHLALSDINLSVADGAFVSILGPFLLIGTLLRLLSIDDALRHIGRKLGLDVTAVRLSNPVAGVDVDKAEDHALAEWILAGRG